MKRRFLIILLLIPTILSASDFNRDTVGIKMIDKSKDHTESKVKPNIHLDFYTGIYQNKTFGTHPILGLRGGGRFNNKSGYYLTTEFRFADSKNNYDVVVDDSLITTNDYHGEYFGLEYNRLLLSKNKHEIISIASIGWDGFRLPKVNDKTQWNGGFGFDIGIGYLYKFRKGGGPSINLLYHFANIDNPNGTIPNNNSFIIRISYTAGFNN